ncbi:MAG: efflux RND transporter periplasmic adaptor subunit [Candidatus Methylopumilus sp.]|nr:efflux RND transporter periplasmic adaptor subunit [Candidatus Methylopumilus sp.]
MKFKPRASFNKLVLSGLLSLASFATLPHLALASQDASRAGLTVTVTRPEVAQIAAVITANGSIAAWQEALIGAQVGGLRMAEVLVNVGDVVQKGQVLALFATDTVLADLAVQKAQQAEATAALADAKANAARARSLKNSGALSAQQINQYLTAEQTAQARLEATAALVQVQELRLKYAEVRAPDDGVISMRQATVGSVVPPGTELFRMVRQQRLEWRAEVTSEELSQIKVGMPVSVFPASLPKGAPAMLGKVRVIGPTVDPQARTAVVFVDLPKNPNDEPPVRAGMFASGQFQLGATQGLTLPQESVVMRDGFSFVFKLGENRRVIQTKVNVGRRVGARIEVLTGVTIADNIVESGAGFLTNDDLVAVSATVQPK